MHVSFNLSGGGMLLAPPAPTCPGPEEPRECILERCVGFVFFMQTKDKIFPASANMLRVATRQRGAAGTGFGVLSAVNKSKLFRVFCAAYLPVKTQDSESRLQSFFQSTFEPTCGSYHQT
jgi:hypothetical protein